MIRHRGKRSQVTLREQVKAVESFEPWMFAVSVLCPAIPVTR